MDDAPWRFAGLLPGEPPDDPLAATKATAPDLRGDCLLRQIEEGRKLWRTPSPWTQYPTAELQEPPTPPSPVSDENANAELLVPRSMPMLNLACAITYPYQKARSEGTRIDRGRKSRPICSATSAARTSRLYEAGPRFCRIAIHRAEAIGERTVKIGFVS